MTTEITPYQPGGALADLASTYGGLAAAGLIGFSFAEFSPPKLRIVNGMKQVTDWGAKPGQIHNTGTGENMDEVRGFILAVGKGQIWSDSFTEAEAKKARGEEPGVYCRSADGVKPDPEFRAKAPAAACAACPNGRPQRNAAGGWDAPKCANSVKAILATWNDADQDYDVAILLVGKTGTKPLLDAVKQVVMRKKAVWGAEVRVCTIKTSGNGNEWFVPDVAVDFTREVPENHRGLIAAKMEQWVPLLGRVDEAEIHDEGHAGGAAIETTARPVQASPPPAPPPTVDLDDVDFG